MVKQPDLSGVVPGMMAGCELPITSERQGRELPCNKKARRPIPPPFPLDSLVAMRANVHVNHARVVEVSQFFMSPLPSARLAARLFPDSLICLSLN